MFTVIARLSALAWKYGKSAITRAITYVRNNRATIDRWIVRFGYSGAVDQVLRAIGVL
ncbi:hypothetical protein ACEUE7_00520 [Micrococcus endophyticus]|uniref:hypothetical protein n=1 Tax=Micrococcus endophyticus TaxID=455343 RepID=UPI0035A9677C